MYKNKFKRKNKKFLTKKRKNQFEISKEAKKQKINNENNSSTSSESSESENEKESTFKQFIDNFSSNKSSSKQSVISSSESEESEDILSEDEKEFEEDLTDKEYDKDEDEIEMNTNNPDIDTIDKNQDLDEDIKNEDPFMLHLNRDLNQTMVESLSNYKKILTINKILNKLGKAQFYIPQLVDDSKKLLIEDNTNLVKTSQIPKFCTITSKNLDNFFIKSQIINNIKEANSRITSRLAEDEILTELQSEIFNILNNYQDLFYPERNFDNADEIRFTYCLHAVNHILKTRTKILHHNARLQGKTEVPDEFRDQGLVRPKILILVPFRHSALRIVQNLIDILVLNDTGGQVINKKRFMDDFTGDELNFPKKNPKPEDYEKLFAGNVDDTFRLGLSITKKCLKLYTDFYSSDIIIASPLGLRVIIKAPGEPDRDFDFLSSIELLIIDQTEQFLMQNWDHFLHIIDHIHLQPKDSHGTDFSRARMWSINGWSKYYRQTLVFSELNTPEINSFVNKRCFNFSGKCKINNDIDKGTICHIVTKIPHVFHKFDCDSIKSMAETRLEFLVKKILPQQFNEQNMKNILIYVPSYFDYVQLRNFMKKEDMSFVKICEYSQMSKVAKARDLFFHGEVKYLLYSERFHHYYRIRLKGIRHIIFYQPPNVPNFYSEMCNFMQDIYQNRRLGKLNNMTVTVLYCKYDVFALNSIIGTERTSRLFQSCDKYTHMFLTGE